MHAYFDCLKWAESHIREEFCTGAGAKVDECAVCVGEELFAVPVLEHFVQTIFTGSLEGVAHESRGPAEKYAADPFLCEDGAPGGEVGFVDVGVDLTAAFYEVEGCDGCVCWAFSSISWNHCDDLGEYEPQARIVSKTLKIESRVHTDNTTKSTTGKILCRIRLNLAKGQALFFCCHLINCSKCTGR